MDSRMHSSLIFIVEILLFGRCGWDSGRIDDSKLCELFSLILKNDSPIEECSNSRATEWNSNAVVATATVDRQKYFF